MKNHIKNSFKDFIVDSGDQVYYRRGGPSGMPVRFKPPSTCTLACGLVYPGLIWRHGLPLFPLSFLPPHPPLIHWPAHCKSGNRQTRSLSLTVKLALERLYKVGLRHASGKPIHCAQVRRGSVNLFSTVFNIAHESIPGTDEDRHIAFTWEEE